MGYFHVQISSHASLDLRIASATESLRNVVKEIPTISLKLTTSQSISAPLAIEY
jgi:hypothetical protein